MFVTETWQSSNVSPAFKATTPLIHKCHHSVRPGAVPDHPGRGLSVIVMRHIPNVKFSCRKFNTFECITMQFNCSSDKIVAYLVYRPAGHIKNDIFVDFESLLIESQMCSGKKLYLGDFNSGWINKTALMQKNLVVYLIILV